MMNGLPGGFLLLILIALVLPPQGMQQALAQEVEENLETLEAPKFDDEIVDENFEGINEDEFEDIIEGEANTGDVLPADSAGATPPDIAPEADGGVGEEEELTLEDSPSAEELPAELPPAEDSEDAPVVSEEPALDESMMAEQQAAPPEESLPAEEMPAEETPALAEDLPPVEEGTPVSEPPMIGEQLPSEMIESMPTDPAMGGMSAASAPPPAQAPAYDAPDEAMENRLHDIFERYNKMPISNEQWAEIAGQKTKEVYSVLRGDSLWEISEMFFGDGNFWPKVWSFNSSITNPHMIEVGDRIMFYPGDEENPPQVVVEPQAPPEEEAAAEMPVEEAVAAEEPQEVYTDGGEAVDIPQPTKFYPPPLRQIPPSLPEEKPVFYEGFDESGFAVSSKRFSKSEVADMKLTSFIAESYPEGLGEVTEMMGGKQSAQLHEYVYVRMKNGAPGDVYTVISQARRGSGEKNIEFTNGVAIQYQGEVELRDVVNEDINLYRALVTSLVDQITVGAKVIEGRIPTVSVSNLGASSDLKGNVIGGEFDVGRTALGVGSVVFLDGGSEAGFQPDMIVGVVANEKLRNEDTKVAVNLRDIGRIKIAKVEPRVSTGIVVYASEEISTGDFIGRTLVAVGGFDSDQNDFGDLGVSGESSGGSSEDFGADLDAGGDDFGEELGAGGGEASTDEFGADLDTGGDLSAGGELSADPAGDSDIKFGEEFSESEEAGDDLGGDELSL